MKIQVTDRHIAIGERAIANACPIALAVKEQTNALLVMVEDCMCKLWMPNKSDLECYPLPLMAVEFYRDFDAQRPVNPFWFELLLPEDQ